MNVTCIAATRPTDEATNGLITLMTEDCPEYLHAELLRHKRLVHSWQSHRTGSYDKGVGFYTPPVFLARRKGMQAGVPLSPLRQTLARMVWHSSNTLAQAASAALERLDVANEQCRRVLPACHTMNGVITGTESAWQRVLDLRDHDQADSAMQLLALQIRREVETAPWKLGATHMPFVTEDVEADPDVWKICAARIARVSYGTPGAKANDLKLGERLLASKHWSPFEHVADLSDKAIVTSALCCKKEDVWGVWHWQNLRAQTEPSY